MWNGVTAGGSSNGTAGRGETGARNDLNCQMFDRSLHALDDDRRPNAGMTINPVPAFEKLSR